ncbi:hypothetical protein HW561_12700 [Rhodobacteraceae bacterium B1Z28]|uniref:Uncharacterized protein n=1 Tax=Ruegeria haliotis TaxID=2747601 RepID=A0ABX2PSX7_9RHOB|nr:hypothetical protein [Ruegeria haliotis]NVO56647.1 hypothetical protein [Ruegeria haliotis]
MRKIKTEDAKEDVSASNYVRTHQFVLGLFGFLKNLGHRRSQSNKFYTEKPLNRTVEPSSSDASSKHPKQSKPTLSNEVGTESRTAERATTFYLP